MTGQSPSLNLTNTPRKPKTKAPARTPPLDWAATHGPVTGALSATTGAAALAFAGTVTGMPTEIPLLLGAAGAAGHGIGHSIYRRLTARTGITRCASWLLAGGWTTWAMAEGPLAWKCLGVLAGAGIGIGAMASNAAAHEEAAEENRLSAEAAKAVADLDSKRRTIAGEWEQRIRRVAGIDVRIFAVELWSNNCGYSVAAELPGGSATWTRIQAAQRALAADARLPRGCTVTAEEGDIQGRVVIDITTENVLGETKTYPDDYGALSILSGIPWGILPSGDEAIVLLREACSLLLGPPGSGKSTFLDAIIAGFGRCTDVLTFVVDFKGGAIGLPWVRPHLEAQGLLDPVAGTDRAPEGTRPGIDWLAATPAEALLMFQAIIAINEARQQQYQTLMLEQNTTLLPVSARIPQIQVVIDEGAELLSATTFGDPVMKELQGLVKKTMRTTRAMAIRLVLTAVDGNVSAIGSTEVRKFSPVGAALTSGETSGNNLSKLFPRAKVDTSQLSQKGAGVIGQAGSEGFAPTPFKGWKTSPSMVRQATLATSDRRPSLDPVSVKAAGEAYTGRWSSERAGWMWGAGEAPQPTTITDTDSRSPARERRSGSGLNLSYMRKDNTPLPAEDADALTARLMREIDERYGTTPEPGTSPTGLNLSYQRNADTPAVDKRLVFVRRLITQAGPDGLETSALWPALTDQYGDDWNRSVVTTWLSEDIRAGRIHRPRKGLYVHGPRPELEQDAEADAQDAEHEPAVNELLPLAIELVTTSQYASPTMLQRKLRTSWETVTALLAFMQQQGIVGPADSDGQHPVLLSTDDINDVIDDRDQPGDD